MQGGAVGREDDNLANDLPEAGRSVLGVALQSAFVVVRTPGNLLWVPRNCSRESRLDWNARLLDSGRLRNGERLLLGDQIERLFGRRISERDRQDRGKETARRVQIRRQRTLDH